MKNELQEACNYFMSTYQIIKHNNELYYFNDGIYKPFAKKARQDIARGYVTENMTDRFKKDVLLNIADNLEEYDGRVNVAHMLRSIIAYLIVIRLKLNRLEVALYYCRNYNLITL